MDISQGQIVFGQADGIAALAGLLLSLAVNYAPGLKDWFDVLTPQPKRLVMLGLLLVATVISLFWFCRMDLSACVALNWEQYASAFVSAAIINQVAFNLSPLPPERRLVRKLADEKHIAALPEPVKAQAAAKVNGTPVPVESPKEQK